VEVNHVAARDLAPDPVRPQGHCDLRSSPTGDANYPKAIQHLVLGQTLRGPGDISVQCQDRDLMSLVGLRPGKVVNRLLRASDERAIPAADVKNAERCTRLSASHRRSMAGGAAGGAAGHPNRTAP
jgi:hypothetical protein